jgi:hypothetical protein
MAKMISNFAIEILHRIQDYSFVCDFADVSEDLNIQYNNGVTNACQL